MDIAKSVGVSSGDVTNVLSGAVPAILAGLTRNSSTSSGAAGLAEVSAAEVMKGVVPIACMGAYVLLWRLFTLLIGLAAGAVVMVRCLYRERKETKPHDIAWRENS